MKKRPKPRKSDTPAKTEPNSKSLPQRIPPEILEKLPEETRIAFVQAVSFRGPLPPPALYRQYEEVLTGSANRIMRLAENEQMHRQTWENNALDYQGKEIERGQRLGFVLAALAIVGGVACVYLEQPWVAAVLVGTALTGILTAFIKDRSDKE